jgi:hypothetical protein
LEVLNGAFDIWQRGTSISTASVLVYTSDRWSAITDGSGTTMQVSRQSVSDSTNLPNIQYCARVARTTTGTNPIYLSQSLETVNSIPYAGKTVTLSFYARKGSGYSPTSSLLAVQLNTGTGTDQNALNGYTGGAAVVNSTATLTTTWQRFTFTGNVSSTANELGIALISTPTGSTTTNDYYEITGVQIDVGSVAQPFRRAMNTIQGELAACQRYYEQSYPDGTAPGTATVITNIEYVYATANIANTYVYKNINFKVTKRGTPTVTIYGYQGGSGKVSNNNGVDLATNSGVATSIGTKTAVVYNNSGADVAPALGAFIFHWVASAEL